MIECTLCKSSLDPNSEGGIAILLRNYIDGSYRHTWDSFDEGDRLNLNNGLVAEVVKVRNGWNDGLESETSSYSHQGDSLTKGKSSRFLIENFREFMLPHDNIDDESYLARHLRQRDKLILLDKPEMVA